MGRCTRALFHVGGKRTLRFRRALCVIGETTVVIARYRRRWRHHDLFWASAAWRLFQNKDVRRVVGKTTTPVVALTLADRLLSSARWRAQATNMAGTDAVVTSACVRHQPSLWTWVGMHVTLLQWGKSSTWFRKRWSCDVMRLLAYPLSGRGFGEGGDFAPISCDSKARRARATTAVGACSVCPVWRSCERIFSTTFLRALCRCRLSGYFRLCMSSFV